MTVLPTVDSTNTHLLQRARDAGPMPRWSIQLCMAERQTAGRGRQGRAWQAEPGDSLTFSLAMVAPEGLQASLSLAVGAAVVEALALLDARHQGRALRLKWPNDLWLADDAQAQGGRKLGGILIETTGAAHEAARTLVIGVGLNLRPMAQAPQASYGVAALNEVLSVSDATTVLRAVAPAVAVAVCRHARAGLAPWMSLWRAQDLLAGRRVVTASSQPGVAALEGVAMGVRSHDGALLLRADDGTEHAVQSGEVSVRVAQTSP